MRLSWLSAVPLLSALMLVSSVSEARLTRLVVSSRTPAFQGRVFAAGSYEYVTGVAYGELDPNAYLNTHIVDLSRAPRNARGMVEYHVDVNMLKPADMTLGSSVLFYEVVNRGNKLSPGILNGKSYTANTPVTAADAGNGFMFDRGYTVVWSGWQADVATGGGRIVASYPIATNSDGSSITGLSRDEFVDTGTAATFTGTLSYTSLDHTGTLTVRENERDPRQTPPGLTYTWVNDKQIKITRPAGFDSGAIYEFVYPAKDPVVAGMAFASTRDLVSFLRNEASDDDGTANPLVQGGTLGIHYALGYGISQSGRMLKDLLYQGFNTDENWRQVFDGIDPHISGSRKTYTNYEFAQPGRFSRQHEDHLFPGDQFPFTYTVTYDQISGNLDGNLLRCRFMGNCPKVIHTDTDTEMYQARGSLVSGDTRGNTVDMPDDVRIFYFSGAQHTPSAVAAKGICQQLSNTLDYGPYSRALIAALEEWVTDLREPPKSRYPTVAGGTLAPSPFVGFPDIPGVTYNGKYNSLTIHDFATQPPTEGAEYPVTLPIVDDDGNPVDGVRAIELQVPTATYAGWNLRSANNAKDELCSLTGSYIPFPATAADRAATGDPRLSNEERYKDHADYVRKVRQAAKHTMGERLLLKADADAIIAAAEAATIPGVKP